MNTRPFKMAKRYVLVDEDVYDRSFRGKETIRETRNVQPPKINPFSNPLVKEVKKEREEIWRANVDEETSAEEANEIVRRLIAKYRLNFRKATRGKRALAGGGDEGARSKKAKNATAKPTPAPRRPTPTPRTTPRPQPRGELAERMPPSTPVVDRSATGR